MNKKPWTLTDIALSGLSSLACGLIFLVFYAFMEGVVKVDLGVFGMVLIVLTWVAASIGLVALVVAGIAKVIGIGVRSAND